MTGELIITVHPGFRYLKAGQDENHVCFEERWRIDAS